MTRIKPFKYKDALLHFLLVTFVCAVLPATITKVSSVFYQDLTNKQTGIENITGNSNRNSSKEKNKDTLAIQPVKNNVTDVLELVRGDFNTKKFPLDKYGNIKGNGTYNSITDDPNKRMDGDFITRMNFGATLGATDTETLDNLEKNAKMKGDANPSSMPAHWSRLSRSPKISKAPTSTITGLVALMGPCIVSGRCFMAK